VKNLLEGRKERGREYSEKRPKGKAIRDGFHQRSLTSREIGEEKKKGREVFTQAKKKS